MFWPLLIMFPMSAVENGIGTANYVCSVLSDMCSIALKSAFLSMITAICGTIQETVLLVIQDISLMVANAPKEIHFASQ